MFDYPALTTQPILESSMVTQAMAPLRFGGKPTQAVHRKGGHLAVAQRILSELCDCGVAGCGGTTDCGGVC